MRSESSLTLEQLFLLTNLIQQCFTLVRCLNSCSVQIYHADSLTQMALNVQTRLAADRTGLCSGLVGYKELQYTCIPQ